MPLFKQNILSLTKIANADEARKFRIVMMVDATRVGQCELTVNDLNEGMLRHDLKNGSNVCGSITFTEYKRIEMPSFVEILRSGMQLSMAIAIDFTASNGDPQDPQSLHCLGQGTRLN